MKLQLIGTVERKTIHEDDWSDETMAFNDEIDRFKDKADFATITTKDGEVYKAGKVNLSGGRCDCCGTFSRSSVMKYEFYKVAT